MVYLRVPLDPSRLRRIDKNVLENNHRNAVQQQMRNGSFDGSDAESGFIENVNDGDLGAVVSLWHVFFFTKYTFLKMIPLNYELCKTIYSPLNHFDQFGMRIFVYLSFRSLPKF